MMNLRHLFSPARLTFVLAAVAVLAFVGVSPAFAADIAAESAKPPLPVNVVACAPRLDYRPGVRLLFLSLVHEAARGHAGDD